MLNRIMGQIEILMGNDFFELLYGQMMIRKTINGCMWKIQEKKKYML